MKKERLETFFDAVLAIIMTILVLDLEKPKTPTLMGLWELREPYMIYALSFFWCGTMWINLYRQWHTIKRIDGHILWMSVIVLFFSSLVPYVTSYAGAHFYSAFAQTLYGMVILLVAVFRLVMNREIARINPDNSYVRHAYPVLEKWAYVDIAIKAFGILLAYLVWPPLSFAAIILATTIFSLAVTAMEKKYDHPDRWIYTKTEEM